MNIPAPATDTAPPPTSSPRNRATGRSGRHRPIHLRPSYLILVLVGGAIGTAGREALALTFPTPAGGVPWVIFGVNIVGAFLLGLLLDTLARRGTDRRRRRALRLLLGTGVLGGFTTYSALATDTADLIGHGAPSRGLAYGLATVLVGGVATVAGIATASAAHRSRTRGAA